MQLVRHAELGVSVERTADPSGELSRADVLVAGVRDVEPVPADLVRAATLAFVPCVLACKGMYRMAVDEASRKAQHAARVRQAVRDRERSAEARANAKAEAGKRRADPAPVSRSGKTIDKARREARERRMREEDQAG